jgi:peptide/nickel transport system permease protein
MNGRILLKYILRRVAKGILVIVGIVLLNFFLIRIAPGDPASVIAGQSGAGDPAYVAQLRQTFGLDRPLAEQLWIYVRSAATLDLGMSYQQQRPVTQMIGERLGPTLLLSAAAFAVALIGGVTLGAIAARRPASVQDTVISLVALTFYATPLFWVGVLLILVFSAWLQWLPSVGMATLGGPQVGMDHVLDIGRHLVLPGITLGLFYLAVYTRLTRAAMIEAGSQDFVRTARAKGASERRILIVHILRNALLPVITFAGLQAGQLIGGAVLVETVFTWPGIGRLAFEALLGRDYNVLLGVLLCTSCFVVLFNIIADVLYVIADPRVEVAG